MKGGIDQPRPEKAKRQETEVVEILRESLQLIDITLNR